MNMSLSHWYPGLGVVVQIPDLCTLTYFNQSIICIYIFLYRESTFTFNILIMESFFIFL